MRSSSSSRVVVAAPGPALTLGGAVGYIGRGFGTPGGGAGGGGGVGEGQVLFNPFSAAAHRPEGADRYHPNEVQAARAKGYHGALPAARRHSNEIHFGVEKHAGSFGARDHATDPATGLLLSTREREAAATVAAAVIAAKRAHQVLVGARHAAEMVLRNRV